MLEPNKTKFDFSSPANSSGQPAPSQALPYSPPALDPVSGHVEPQNNEPVYKGVHPIAALFHILFKMGAILTFILQSFLSLGYVTMFVVTILFLAADFWTTKNVTGRLLVSLRWWNEVRDDGTSAWVFESAPDAERRVNEFDKWYFWITTGGNCAFWGLMVLFNVMSFSRLPMAVIGLVLGCANFVGFLKCSRDAKKRITNFMISRAADNTNLVRRVTGAI